jgi:hypothetical protein
VDFDYDRASFDQAWRGLRIRGKLHKAFLEVNGITRRCRFRE